MKAFFLSFSIIVALTSCNQIDEAPPSLPSLKTSIVTVATISSAVISGEIIKDGGTKIRAKGVCWSLNASPTIEDSKTNEGEGSHSFVSHLTPLEAGTKYYARAYAINESGTFYGNEVLFTTSILKLTSWEISKSTTGFDINPRDIFFIDSKVGFVVGFNGDIYKTIDFGESWQKQNSGTTLHLYSVFFLNENVGFVAGHSMSGCLDDDCNKGSVLLKTTNGGETWSKTFFEDFIRMYSVKFFDDSKGLAIVHTPDVPNSRDYYLAKTSDGGTTWQLIDLAINPILNKYFCVDNLVFITGEGQKIFKSRDYGISWETINTPIPPFHDVSDVYFFNESIGYADGMSAIYKTTNGGLDWKEVDFPFFQLRVFHFYNETEGFSFENISVYEGGDYPVSKGSIGYQTFNGGESWDKTELLDSLHLGLTHFPRRDLGYGINISEFYTIKRKN